VRRAIASAACALALFAAHDARAMDVELGAAAGAATYASTWSGDFGLGSTLRAGVRFQRVFAIDFQAWESYATVNHRLNTGLSIGATGYLPLESVHPYGRLFVLHQHEEGIVSVENTPSGFVFGIGAGIRHRAGGGLALGAEFPVKRAANDRLTWLIFADGMLIYFPDATLGPHAYFGVEGGIAFDWLLK
jgi:hypothetical protein